MKNLLWFIAIFIILGCTEDSVEVSKKTISKGDTILTVVTDTTVTTSPSPFKETLLLEGILVTLGIILTSQNP